ncbi:hypothetical protein V8F20_010440 [Naviculisporaceae sp. PSN 640]
MLPETNHPSACLLFKGKPIHRYVRPPVQPYTRNDVPISEQPTRLSGQNQARNSIYKSPRYPSGKYKNPSALRILSRQIGFTDPLCIRGLPILGSSSSHSPDHYTTSSFLQTRGRCNKLLRRPGICGLLMHSRLALHEEPRLLGREWTGGVWNGHVSVSVTVPGLHMGCLLAAVGSPTRGSKTCPGCATSRVYASGSREGAWIEDSGD